MERTVITNLDAPLDPGDIIELRFKSTGMFWIQATHIAMIEWRLSGDKRFRIRNYTIYEPNTVVFKVEVLQTNPVIVTASVIAAAIIGVGVIFILTLESVYKLVNVPIEALQKPAITVIAVGVLLAVLGSIGLKFFKK